jgi:outer membrane protein assembly factor BamB
MSSMLKPWIVATAAMSVIAVAELWAQADGTHRWAGPFTTGGFLVSSPTIGADGTIYIGSEDKYLYAVNPNGTLKWRFLAGDWIDSSPAIGRDGTIYFGCWDGKLYALRDEGTQARRVWEYAIGAGNYVYSSPALGADGTIYFGGGDGRFYALRPNGTLKWSYPTGNWIWSSPAVSAEGLVYFGSLDGKVYALRDSGSRAVEVWRFDAGGIVLSSPALGPDGSVYFGSYAKKFFAVDGATGTLRWAFSTGNRIESSATVGPDGTVYFGCNDGFFYALNPDGTPMWKYMVGHVIASTPAVRADGTIVVGTGKDAVYAFNADGTVKWIAATGDWVDSSPVIASDGTIYIGCYDKKLYALNGTGSPLSVLSSWPMFRRDREHGGRIPTPVASGRLVNLSTRAQAGPTTNLIGGFVVRGGQAKSFLIRAMGPTLVQLDVPGVLPWPRLELHAMIANQDTILGINDGWEAAPNADEIQAASAAVGAFPFSSGSKDAAWLGSLPSSAQTALVQSADGAAGVALMEVFDADTSDLSANLINLSTRGFVGTGNNLLMPGLVIGGDGPLRLLIRAVGPGLERLGVSGVLARPTITLFSGMTPVVSNVGWTTGGYTGDIRAAAKLVGAFALVEGSADSALLVTLNPGPYTFQVSGLEGTTGEALVEVYVVP